MWGDGWGGKTNGKKGSKGVLLEKKREKPGGREKLKIKAE